MSVAAQAAHCFERGPTVFSVLVLTAIGVLALIGLVATVVIVARDGYRAIPTRRV